jgi:predicted nucleic acid-binding protein
MIPLRLVIDTNIVVSAALKKVITSLEFIGIVAPHLIA